VEKIAPDAAANDAALSDADRAVLRDSIRGFALIFYATPWPVLTVLAFVLAAYALGRNHRARALALTLVFFFFDMTFARNVFLVATVATFTLAVIALRYMVPHIALQRPKVEAT